MTDLDRIAERLRAAYGKHSKEDWCPWIDAAPDKKAAWRAIAKEAIAMGAAA